MARKPVEEVDDRSISDDAYILRKVHPSQMALEAGALRVTSNAFRDIRDATTGKTAVSVFVEPELELLGSSAADLVEHLEGFGVVALKVGTVRQLGLGVTMEPNGLSFGAAHAHLNGDKSSRAVRRQLAEQCDYRVWPTDIGD